MARQDENILDYWNGVWNFVSTDGRTPTMSGWRTRRNAFEIRRMRMLRHGAALLVLLSLLPTLLLILRWNLLQDPHPDLHLFLLQGPHPKILLFFHPILPQKYRLLPQQIFLRLPPQPSLPERKKGKNENHVPGDQASHKACSGFFSITIIHYFKLRF